MPTNAHKPEVSNTAFIKPKHERKKHKGNSTASAYKR
jgi:hypothetical protein